MGIHETQNPTRLTKHFISSWQDILYQKCLKQSQTASDDSIVTLCAIWKLVFVPVAVLINGSSTNHSFTWERLQTSP
uniref:Uncharacterized protein n=1 Tax=Strongyloides venezuelensis TaxID=75913 RepID=A0A0K0FGT3_STRVS